MVQHGQVSNQSSLRHKNKIRPGMVVHAFDPSTWDTEDFCEFKASLVYKASFRTARAVTQRNSVSKKKKKKREREREREREKRKEKKRRKKERKKNQSSQSFLMYLTFKLVRWFSR